MSNMEGVSRKGLINKDILDGKNLRIGIIYTRWNKDIVDNLVKGCRKSLNECNVNSDNIIMTEVSGSFELPLAAKYLAKSVDAVICIGCLIKGESMHFEYTCNAVSCGIMQVGLETGIPIIFGVLTCLHYEQAKNRAGLREYKNQGEDWGFTAVDMALLHHQITTAI
jgi:6,7-dimethyl-8-ribityllumazine synthase